jgi:hypothetical protein
MDNREIKITFLPKRKLSQEKLDAINSVPTLFQPDIRAPLKRSEPIDIIKPNEVKPK